MTHSTLKLVRESKKRSRMCYGKKTFSEYETALGRARRFGLFVYQCPVCSLYHTTSNKDAVPSLEGNENLLNQRKQKNQAIHQKFIETKTNKKAKKKLLQELKKQYLNGDISLRKYNESKKVLLKTFAS